MILYTKTYNIIYQTYNIIYDISKNYDIVDFCNWFLPIVYIILYIILHTISKKKFRHRIQYANFTLLLYYIVRQYRMQCRHYTILHPYID